MQSDQMAQPGHQLGATAVSPNILRLKIERFRGIEGLTWYPNPGLNIILGGGDVGKTTILDAIALLLHPINTVVLSDSDYWGREIEHGFCIEAVMSLPDECGINQQTRSAWPWEWDGSEPILPRVDSVPGENDASRPVYRLRFRGAADFDYAFEVIQPDGSIDHLSVAVRRRIGLVRLGGEDRNDRDLRLIQGSALDRLLSDKTLRSRLGQKLGESDINDKLTEDAREKLVQLDKSFKEQALPTGLSLALTGAQGLSLNALIGLSATKGNVALPLSSWGAGTRRLAALQISAAQQGENPITLVDEVERGLEPYRQRILMAELQKSNSQVFLTTHSSAALSAGSSAAIWYVDFKGAIGQVPSTVNSHLKRDPETFFSRITIVAEGLTELGFVDFLLKKAIGDDLLDHGIWITDGAGNDNTLNLLEALVGSRLTLGGFADDEGRAPSRWAAIKEHVGPLLFRWPVGCLEENIIRLVPSNRLGDFIRDLEGESGVRLRTLADRLGIDEKSFAAIQANGSDLTSLIIEAATGVIPDGMNDLESSDKKALKKHAERWFKSMEGGRELAYKVFEFGLWPHLKGQLLPFINAVRISVSLPPITELRT